jgi:TIR domain
MSFYQIGILGSPSVAHAKALNDTIRSAIEPFKLEIGTGLDLVDPVSCLTRDQKQAFAAVYFGGATPDSNSLKAVTELMRQNVPIIPVVDELTGFSTKVPEALCAANGLQISNAGPRFEVLAAALLECVGLLRRQRRVFISYRRTESANAALQLHEALSSHGFDVFLDTYDVRPGEDFQAILWHRLCDSDVMVMLDTPAYFEARWTAAEIGRALAKKIAVLGVIWPDHTPQRLTQLREPIYLDKADLKGPSGPLVDAVVERVCIAVERLRSRSIAIRHAAIAGAVRSATEEIGGVVSAVGVHRSIKIVLADGRELYLFPAVGVPTAENFYDVAQSASAISATTQAPIVVYDHVGLHVRWQRHLEWLHDNLSVVRTLQIAQAAWQLADWQG